MDNAKIQGIKFLNVIVILLKEKVTMALLCLFYTYIFFVF